MVKKLDDLIEQEEGDGPRAPFPPSAPTPGEPAPDSIAGGVRGRGDVTPRELPADEPWGKLSPAERQEVLQQIGRDLPAHYREVIEAYFRRLARDGAK